VSVLRRGLLWAARQQWLRRGVLAAPVTRGVVARFVAGEDASAALGTVRELRGAGLQASLDYLGEDTRDAGQARAVTDAYLLLLDQLTAAGLAAGCDLSVKLSAVGQAFDEALAESYAREISTAAAAVSTTVTLDMEDHTTTDSTLRILDSLRRDFPATGAVIQAYLRRSEDDCRRLSGPGSRVRLCKGAYDEPASVAYQRGRDVDRSYARCLAALLSGSGYPMIATHDPRLIRLAHRLIGRCRRDPAGYEFQMLFGVRPDEQRRLAAQGHRVRVYIPYGQEWYGYLMRRIAERPANLAFFLRALASRG
jgi:proline dehydrogenase